MCLKMLIFFGVCVCVCVCTRRCMCIGVPILCLRTIVCLRTILSGADPDDFRWEGVSGKIVFWCSKMHFLSTIYRDNGTSWKSAMGTTPIKLSGSMSQKRLAFWNFSWKMSQYIHKLTWKNIFWDNFTPKKNSLIIYEFI